MSRFSASDAALEGFQVLRSQWRVIVGWAVFNLLALVAMIVVTVIISVGVGLATGADQASGTAAAIGGLVGLLVTALIEAALVVGIYRLMLRPTDPGFLHLRLGRDEGRLLVVVLILGAGVLMLAALSALLGSVLEGVMPQARIILYLVALGVGAWLALRLGLTAPISFAEKRIDLRRSWRLSRGNGWALLGMWFLNFCLVMLVWLALWLAEFLLSGLLTGFHGFARAEDSEALVSHPGRYLLEAILPILCTPALLLLSQAPWVAAYRALTTEPQAA